MTSRPQSRRARRAKGTKGGADDSLFATDTTGLQNGQWTWNTGALGTEGRFYAKVKRTPRCKAAVSRDRAGGPQRLAPSATGRPANPEIATRMPYADYYANYGYPPRWLPGYVYPGYPFY